MSAGQRLFDFFHVEEQKSRLRGVGFDGFGGELCGFDLVTILFAECAFHLFLRDRHGYGVRVGAGIREAAKDIVGNSRCELVTVSCSKRNLHVRDGDRLVAVIGDDEEYGKESVLGKIDGENSCFVGSVVGVGSDGDFIRGVIVVGGVQFGGLSGGFDEGSRFGLEKKRRR